MDATIYSVLWSRLVSLFGSIYSLDLVHLSVFKIKIEMLRERSTSCGQRVWGRSTYLGPMGKNNQNRRLHQRRLHSYDRTSAEQPKVTVIIPLPAAPRPLAPHIGHVTFCILRDSVFRPNVQLVISYYNGS